MSVINKMLRDLDARRGEARLPDLPQGAIPAAMEGTASVGASAGPRVRRWGAGLIVLLLCAAALAWYLHATQAVAPPPLAVAPVAAPAAAPVPAPEVPTQPQAPVPQPAEPAAEPPQALSEAAPSASEPQAATEPEPPRKPRRRSEAVETAQTPPATERPRKRSRTASEAEPESRAPAIAPASAAPMATDVSAPAAVQRRQSAAQETLAQAQALWNAGSREAALQLVQDAVAVAERAQPVDATLLAQLVREQVRMELALGRPGPALAVLTRLEPALSGQADLWAVRGNAAQRLGRHQESVQAYLTALQLRPGEPRWMLGAAVSLAALGQLDAAARQAEQARALGPVSPEVLTYLRQAGVALR